MIQTNIFTKQKQTSRLTEIKTNPMVTTGEMLKWVKSEAWMNITHTTVHAQHGPTVHSTGNPRYSVITSMRKIWKRLSIYLCITITAETQHWKSTTNNIKIRKQRTEKMYLLLSAPGLWQEGHPQTYSRVPILGFSQPQVPMIYVTQLCHCPFLTYIYLCQLFLFFMCTLPTP